MPELISADPWRRLMGFVYESVILFGVLWFAGYIFSSLTQYQAQRGNIAMHHSFQVFTFVVLGVYFAWFWAKSRRTVPMKAVSLDLVDTQGKALSLFAAIKRYLVGLAIFLGTMALAMAVHLSLVILLLVPYLWCFFDAQKRSLVDVLAGTRLIFRSAS